MLQNTPEEVGSIMSAPRRIERWIELLPSMDKASWEQQFQAIRREIEAQRDLVFRVKFMIQLHAVSESPADLDAVYRTIERVKGREEKDEALEDLVTALIAMGRYRQAGARAREIRSARRGRLLNCVRAAESAAAVQRHAQEAAAPTAGQFRFRRSVAHHQQKSKTGSRCFRITTPAVLFLDVFKLSSAPLLLFLALF